MRPFPALDAMFQSYQCDDTIDGLSLLHCHVLVTFSLLLRFRHSEFDDYGRRNRPLRAFSVVPWRWLLGNQHLQLIVRSAFKVTRRASYASLHSATPKHGFSTSAPQWKTRTFCSRQQSVIEARHQNQGKVAHLPASPYSISDLSA